MLESDKFLDKTQIPKIVQNKMSLLFLGVLNVYLRLKGQTTIENPLWSSSGNKGQRWNEAHVNIYPITSFQVRKEPLVLLLFTIHDLSTKITA